MSTTSDLTPDLAIPDISWPMDHQHALLLTFIILTIAPTYYVMCLLYPVVTSSIYDCPRAIRQFARAMIVNYCTHLPFCFMLYVYDRVDYSTHLAATLLFCSANFITLYHRYTTVLVIARKYVLSYCDYFCRYSNIAVVSAIINVVMYVSAKLHLEYSGSSIRISSVHDYYNYFTINFYIMAFIFYIFTYSFILITYRMISFGVRMKFVHPDALQFKFKETVFGLFALVDIVCLIIPLLLLSIHAFYETSMIAVSYCLLFLHLPLYTLIYATRMMKIIHSEPDMSFCRALTLIRRLFWMVADEHRATNYNQPGVKRFQKVEYKPICVTQ